MVTKAATATNTPGPTHSGFAPQRLEPLRTTFGRDSAPVPLRTHVGPWWGVVVHTTGSGVREFARKHSWTPSEAALWCYAQEWAGHPHYLIDDAGVIWQITDESLNAVHCGAKTWMRNLMLSGEWVHHVSPVGLALWQKRWPGIKSPQHLFPGSSGNAAYLGIEMIPRDDATYSDAQYTALKVLLSDLSTRYGFPLSGSHVVGHEDLIPFDTSDAGRWDKHGGWDPGAIRDTPHFDWSRVI